MARTVDDDPLIEKLLAGMPVRVLDGFTGNDPGVKAAIDADLEALASLGLALTPVAPPPSLRDRIAKAIEATPSSSRRAALLIVDMLRDHLEPGSVLEVPRARDIVPAVKQRIAQARREGEPVVYLVDHHEPGDPELLAWPMHNTRAPLDDIWPELPPAADDTLVTHRSYSGFFETRLHDVLRGMDVNTLVITGCITEIHVFATATDALQRGYAIELPRDCQAGSSAESERVVLNTLTVMAPTAPFA